MPRLCRTGCPLLPHGPHRSYASSPSARLSSSGTRQTAAMPASRSSSGTMAPCNPSPLTYASRTTLRHTWVGA